MASKKILLSEAKEGMELTKDIYDISGRLLVPFGTILDREIINKLENYDVVVVKVIEKSEIDELYLGSTKDYPNEETTYFGKIKSSPEYVEFEKQFNTSVNDLKIEFNDIVMKNKAIEIDEMLQGVKQIIASNKTKYGLLDILTCMRGYDDLTFAHSMNVSLICSIIADWMGYSDSDKELLMAAGLLHDIGKIKIPREIITKPGRLTEKEYNIVKMHPVLGYEILMNQKIELRIKNAALCHHERFDGSGYPRKLPGNSIEEISGIVAIADVYDAMTANRVYREGLSPFTVTEFFEENIIHFDPKILLMFLNKTAQSYVSSTALLSNGEEGKIAMINNHSIGRPVVMCGNKVIDLSKDKSINIVKVY